MFESNMLENIQLTKWNVKPSEGFMAWLNSGMKETAANSLQDDTQEEINNEY